MKSKIKNKIGIIVIVLIVVFGIHLLSTRNTIVNLEESVDAQYIVNKSNYDNMWKKFREIVQVPEIQAKNIKDIYTGLISGRYNDQNLLFKQIKEDNPKINTKVYEEIQREIIAGRNTFDNNQKNITDKIREYNVYIKQHFVTAFILNKKPKKADDFIITSARTQNAFNTKQDDEINLIK